MTTRVEVLGRVRAELGDNGPAYVWSTAQIYGWLGEGLNQLSLDLPPLVYMSFYAIPGQREYPLSGYDAIGPGGLQSVEAPRGRRLPPGEVRERSEGYTQQNTLLASDTAPRIYENCWALEYFTHDQPYLIFRYAPIEVGGPGDLLIGVWAYGYYANPPDDTTPLDVAQFDEGLLGWYVCARALSWLAEMRGKRGEAVAVQQAGNAGYYERLYSRGIAQRKRAAGAKTSIMNFELSWGGWKKMEQSEQENEARKEYVKAMLKLIFNGPDMELPDAPPLPPNANEVEKALEARIVRLEEQMQFLVKVTWRTSAAVIGTVFAGPAREVLLSAVQMWLGQ